MKRLTNFAFTVSSALALVVCAARPVALEGQNCWVRGSNPGDRPSPLDSAVVVMGEDVVKVCYGAPSARDRTLVGGEIHPFGSRWRLGANEATAIHLPFAASVAGVGVDAGSYSLYAVPGEASWDIFVNGTAERWGVPINEAVTAEDLGGGTVSVSQNDHVETLDMSFENVSADAATLVVRWEGYRVEVPVERRD